MKLLLDAAGRLAPLLPHDQRHELDVARRKLLETSRSFSNTLKDYFRDPVYVSQSSNFRNQVVFKMFKTFVFISEQLQFYWRERRWSTERMI